MTNWSTWITEKFIYYFAVATFFVLGLTLPVLWIIGMEESTTWNVFGWDFPIGQIMALTFTFIILAIAAILAARVLHWSFGKRKGG